MVRDKQDLCISVPSFFKCPISLDIMKSPVNLCTELTYNRFNIQRWLDDGNNTCPATMQLLPTKHFIPNCTLQNLIQICSDSLRRQTAFEPLISCDQVIPIVTNLKTNSDSLRFASLAKLLHFAKDSHQNKSFLAKIEGFVDQLVRFLDNVDGGVTAGTSVKFLERVVIVLGLVVWRRPSIGQAGPLGGDFPVVTSEGHNIPDVIFTSPIENLAEVAKCLDKVDGVVDHGVVSKVPCTVVIASQTGLKILDKLTADIVG
ncbi:U-box domain-containing protein 27 [Glycine soja]|uniref:U-box domain-containing protein n=1 Tax=Glycine soja TaxID=3848 RepID=A0A0B2SK71_GLYSO|nr:U-box domain-containing protein 27 [Glycine soja]